MTATPRPGEQAVLPHPETLTPVDDDDLDGPHPVVSRHPRRHSNMVGRERIPRMSSMDTPPTDHGSDRYDYVEIEAPPGVQPRGDWWDDILHMPCADCNANVFARWLRSSHAPAEEQYHRTAWYITYAHDETCPWLTRYEVQS